MNRLSHYWRLYKQTPQQTRIFFWTVVLFFLMIAVPTAWTYARLYYARTQIPDPSYQVTPKTPS